MTATNLSEITFWIPVIISVFAVILFYVDMRRRLKQEQDASKSMLDLINVMREELTLFREQIGRGKLSNEEFERQKLLQRQEELKWRKARDIVKGIKWLAENVDDTEDEEE
jgi:hypothetical protein